MVEAATVPQDAKQLLSSVVQHPSSYIYYKKEKIHSSCEIEDFVETHLCRLCVILRSRVLLGVCPC